MFTDVRGKINEKKLSFSQTLLPLFEAIVNSIHAIQDQGGSNPGIIKITIERDTQIAADLVPENPVKPPVHHFTIEDNGIGFTEDNFNSFNYAHSTYKEKRGGKGLGRFTWLRAFSEARIESTYQENGAWFNRKFSFKLTQKGVEDVDVQPIKQNGHTLIRKTVVRLVGMKKEYQKWCNLEEEDIALKIIEHCFVYFLGKNCPRIIIADGDKEVVVNDLLKVFTKGENVITKKFSLKQNEFKVFIIKLYDDRPDNKFHYCAHSREVESEKISKSIPELDSHIVDKDKGRYSIAAFITGSYLDQKVNEERTKIDFASELQDSPQLALDVDSDITQEEIRDKATDVIKTQFSDLITELSKKRLKRITNFTETNPWYKNLLKYKKEEILKIPSNISEGSLEIELFKVKQKLELEIREETRYMISQFNSPDHANDIPARFDSLYEKITEVGKSPLAEYVVKRKVILELLEKKIRATDKGKFETEDAIHKLIFPLKTHSDEVGFEEHNLWVVDEKLSFHSYLASDIPLKQLKKGKIQSDDRPDIILFKTPHALVADEKPFNSVVILEFKRPMRNDYKGDENPIEQVNRYARKIRNGKAMDKDSRELQIRANVPIYAYIICDITPRLRELAADYTFIPYPDGDGYFQFNREHNMFIEVTSFEKLIRDSKQRNQALFHKLNIQ